MAFDTLHHFDQRLFLAAARARWRGSAPWLQRLSRAADHGALWWACAAALDAGRSRTGRRAALRGVGALLVASPLTNLAVKSVTRRQRPALETVPLGRRLLRQPRSSSFPSGHAASAAAFLTGVALESPWLGAGVAPVALGVMASRVYVGVHYPGDVLAGAAIGAGAGLLTLRWWPLVPETVADRPPEQPAAAPALGSGAGLHLVVNTGAGAAAARTARGELEATEAKLGRLAALLPEAAFYVSGPGGLGGDGPGQDGLGADGLGEDGLAGWIEKAARAAAVEGGALGVYGGDGTVNRAAAAAVRYAVPLAVFPGGTLNHFAADLGIGEPEETAEAVRRGEAAVVDVGVVEPGRVFVNTFSLGVYPELVRTREELTRYAGKWPALAAALVRVLATAEPVAVRMDGRARRLWMLFAGNGRYAPPGFAPVRRTGLRDGVLDVRTVDGGHPFSRTRLVLAFLTGTIGRSPVYRQTEATSLELDSATSPTADLRMALDGEAVPVPPHVRLRSAPGALTVYRLRKPA